MLKRTISAVLALLLAFALCSPALAEKANRSFEGGVFRLSDADDFAMGELEGLVVDETVGDGALVLADGAATGVFTSDVIGVEPFEYLVASWNADMPSGAELEVYARAYVDAKNAWSDWMSWGVWKDSVKRGSADDEDDLAYLDVDTFTVKGSAGETASLVQMKAELRASAAGESPVLRLLAATYKNTLEGQAIAPRYQGEEVALPERVQLDTPAYSQQIRDRSMAGVMCSAVTVCTLLNDRGENAIPEQVALMDYDCNYDGFGNWSYSVAAAGAFGYEAWCQYADLDVLRQELAHGRSVGVSVRYSDSPSGSYPYLEGAPISGTAGHLITITGYETVDGVDYFFSSDSAAGRDEQCFRRYRADQLANAWVGRLAYIVRDKEAEPAFAPGRIQAALEPVAGAENAYMLMVDGVEVKLARAFYSARLKSDGNGILAYYIEGDGNRPAIPEGAKRTAANEYFRYTLSVNEDGSLRILPAQALSGFDGAEAVLRVFVIANDGTTYEAPLTLANPSYTPEPTAAPTPEPAAGATPEAAPEATAEPASAEPAPANGGMVWIIVAVAAVVLMAVVIVLARKRAARK